MLQYMSGSADANKSDTQGGWQRWLVGESDVAIKRNEEIFCQERTKKP